MTPHPPQAVPLPLKGKATLSVACSAIFRKRREAKKNGEGVSAQVDLKIQKNRRPGADGGEDDIHLNQLNKLFIVVSGSL